MRAARVTGSSLRPETWPATHSPTQMRCTLAEAAGAPRAPAAGPSHAGRPATGTAPLAPAPAAAPTRGPQRPRRRGALCAASPPASASASTASAGTATTAGLRDDFAQDRRPVILFDGVCNLCNGGVNFMLDNDPTGEFRLAALQSPAGRRLLARSGRSPDDLSSIVLVERDRHYIRSEAILRIGAHLRLPLPLLAAFGFPVPLPLRDTLYDAVANNRYSFFGRTDACRLDGAAQFANRFIVD